MQPQFHIGYSKSLLILILSGHGLTALLIFFYLAPGFLQASLFGVIVLLAADESKHLFRQGILKFHPTTDGTEIEFCQSGQPYFYRKYKVYQTRWFAILKLVDNKNPRTLILNPERFESEHCYYRLRYLLQKLECPSVA